MIWENAMENNILIFHCTHMHNARMLFTISFFHVRAKIFMNVLERLLLFWTWKDRAERLDFWPLLWLFSSPFLFPPKKEERRKREWIAKNLIKSPAFLLDHVKGIIYFSETPFKYVYYIWLDYVIMYVY